MQNIPFLSTELRKEHKNNLCHYDLWKKELYIMLLWDSYSQSREFIPLSVTPCIFRGCSAPHWIFRGRGGGCHFHCKLYHIHVNRPQKSTINKDWRVDQKTPLMGDMGQLAHPKWGWRSCFHDQLYPKPRLFSYFIPQMRIRYEKKRLLSICERNGAAHWRWLLYSSIYVFLTRIWGLIHLFWCWFQVNILVALICLPFFMYNHTELCSFGI